VHVTLRVANAVSNLRRRSVYHAVREATLTTARRENCRIVHLSIQRTHLRAPAFGAVVPPPVVPLVLLTSRAGSLLASADAPLELGDRTGGSLRARRTVRTWPAFERLAAPTWRDRRTRCVSDDLLDQGAVAATASLAEQDEPVDRSKAATASCAAIDTHVEQLDLGDR
jgi:hypothetical protein